MQFDSVPKTVTDLRGRAFLITSLEGFLLTPALMSRAARINSAAIFTGLLFWSWIWGVWASGARSADADDDQGGLRSHRGPAADRRTAGRVARGWRGDARRCGGEPQWRPRIAAAAGRGCSTRSLRDPGATRIRFGLDPIIGLVPGIGDLASPLLTVAILWHAAKLRGSRRSCWLRMVSTRSSTPSAAPVPVVGDLFDFAPEGSTEWNMALLERHADAWPARRRRADYLVVVILHAVVSSPRCSLIAHRSARTCARR